MMKFFRGLFPEWAVEWPKGLNLPLNKWTNDFVEWLVSEYGVIFETTSDGILVVLVGLERFLRDLPWLVVFAGVIVLTYFSSGRKWGLTALVAASMFFIGLTDPRLWDLSMMTLSVMLVSTIICIGLGVPIGIAISRNDRMRDMVLPALDLMQTMPSFVYLIPAIMLFGLGAVPAVFATVIYAIPPVVRLTDLGIRLVDEDLVEASDAMGASKRQKLLRVQIPMALPNIMQGVNQTTMMALAMVVIASMIGTRGLGTEVLIGLQQLNVGRALEAGVAIVLLAIVMDRVTQAYGGRFIRASGRG